MNKLPQLIIIIFIQLLINNICMAEQTSISLVSQNLNRFFDDKDDGRDEKIVSTKHFQRRLQKLIYKIERSFEFADVIAFQEIENIDILQQLSSLIKQKYGQQYRPVLIEGNDRSGMDVGYLVKSSWRIKDVYPLFGKERLAGYPKFLFSRPPLVIEVCQRQCLTIVNLHLRSMRGLRSSKHTDYVVAKRKRQAETLARWINRFQMAYPDKKLIVIGDFNALSPSDRYVDVIGTIIGKPDQQKPAYKSQDLIDRDLIDITLNMKPSKRYSYIYKRKKQQLDYALVSQNLEHRIRKTSFSWIDYIFSDHAALRVDIDL